jgi:hypothetical protein
VGTVIIVLVVVGIAGAFVWMAGLAIFAMFRKPIECPACGRKIRIVEKSAKCYKCKTKLFKHSDGNYMMRT